MTNKIIEALTKTYSLMGIIINTSPQDTTFYRKLLITLWVNTTIDPNLIESANVNEFLLEENLSIETPTENQFNHFYSSIRSFYLDLFDRSVESIRSKITFKEEDNGSTTN